MSIVTCAAYKSRKFDYMLFNFGGVGGVDYKPVDYKHSVTRSACQVENRLLCFHGGQREWFQYSRKNSLHMGDEDAVVGDRNARFLCTVDAVMHFTAV